MAVDTFVCKQDIHQNGINDFHVAHDDNPKVFDMVDYIVAFVFVFHSHMEPLSMFVHMHKSHRSSACMDNKFHDDSR